MSEEEEVEEVEEVELDEMDDEFEDELEDGPLDDDLEIVDEDEEEVPRPRRSNSDDDLSELDKEQALKANPKRAKMLRKRARKIEGLLDAAELETPEGVEKAWAALSKDTDTDIRREYNVAEDYSENDVIEHPKFGVGFVVEIMSERKMSVLFEDGLRRLVFNLQK